MPFTLRDLLEAHPDIDELIRPDVRAAFQHLRDVDGPDPIDLAGACLGDSDDAVAKLVDTGALPDALPEAAKRELADRLGVVALDRRIVREHRSEVASFLGLLGGVRIVEAELPKKGEPDYPLFPHQRRALRDARDLLAQGAERLLLHMPTGAGKTRTTMNLICERVRGREDGAVLWVASTGELCEQAALEFARAWAHLGNRAVPIMAAWGGRKWGVNDIHDGLVVATPQTLHSRKVSDGSKFLSDLAMKIHLIVFDEAHQAIAPTYRDVTEHLSVTGASLGKTPVIGLSATPGRTFAGSGADEELAEFFGHTKVTLDTAADGGPRNPVEYLIEQGYLARPHFELIVPDGNHTVSDELGSSDVTFDPEDKVTTALGPVEYLGLVSQTVFRLVDEGHARVLVFAASVQLSRDLAAVLRAAGVAAESLDGTTRDELRAGMIERFRNRSRSPRVLVNFGVLTTGFDAPQTSAAVIARPTRSLVLYNQMVGRAIRGPLAGGNKEATVVTVVDPNVPAFGSIASAFTHWEELWDE